MIYQRLPNWILGFHGTDKNTVQKVLNNPRENLDPSQNDYDWLGDGIYFWENDPDRALEFTKERMARHGITDQEPAVIGAVIDLGLCLNLFDQAALTELKRAHDDFALDMKTLGIEMPVNKGGGDRLLRYLDRAVIQHLHRLRSESKRTLRPYQTVRSGFHEGGQIYEGAGFYRKNHIQIAVIDKSCIKGYFLPRQSTAKKKRGAKATA